MLPLLVLFTLAVWAPANIRAQSLKLTRSQVSLGVDAFRVDGSGRWVVIREGGELFSRRLDRSFGPVRLIGPTAGSLFPDREFVVSLDGTRVVFQDESSLSRPIYSVPIDGRSGPVQLNGPLASSGFAVSFQVSPDSSRVAYVADEDGDSSLELRSVPIDGNAPSMQLNGSERLLTYFAISPDGTRVLFRGYFFLASKAELFSVPIDGSGPVVRLNQSVANTDVLDFRIAPAGDRVVFWAEKTQYFTTTRRLYSVQIDGLGGAVQISGSGGNVELSPGNGTPVPFAIDSDGTRVVYVADHDKANLFELFSVPTDGSSSPVQLNATLVQGGDISVGSVNAPPFLISPDGASVAYSADQEVNDLIELYQVPIDGSATAVKLSGPLTSGGNVYSFQYSPTSAAVAYVADQDTDGVFELYGVPADGSAAAVKLNGPLGPSGLVTWFSFEPTGAQIVYVAKQDQASVYEIHRAPIDGSSPPRKINPAPVAGGEVQRFPAPLTLRGIGGPYVLFAGDLALDEADDLYLGFLGKRVLPTPGLPNAR